MGQLQLLGAKLRCSQAADCSSLLCPSVALGLDQVPAALSISHYNMVAKKMHHYTLFQEVRRCPI